MNKKKLINQINIYRSVLILLVICVFATILSPSFLSVTNLFNVFKQITVAGIVGCGMTFVILTGGIDLSVGSILGLSGVLASGVLASTGNTAAAVAVSLTVGIACGAVNGFFVSVCGIPPFISTLGMMTLLRGVILVYTKGSPIPTNQMPTSSLVKAVSQEPGAGHHPHHCILIGTLYPHSDLLRTQCVCGGRKPRGSASFRYPGKNQ